MIMSSTVRMTDKMHQLQIDVDKVSHLISTIQHEVAHIGQGGSRAGTLALLKRQLGEAHSRLEGLHEFIIACEQQAELNPEEEEIDLWM